MEKTFLSEKTIGLLKTIVSQDPNIVGYSNILHSKRNEPETMVARIYVKERAPVLIPKEIDGILTEAIVVGKVKAMFETTKRYRPLTCGISIGNVRITAGTNGWYYLNEEERVFLGSNAHVFTPDPSKPAGSWGEQDRVIVQPGVYDGGGLEDRVALYIWHGQVLPEGVGVNKMDFSVAEPEVESIYNIWNEYTPKRLIGHLFAGSDTITVHFKGKYIAESGYKPVNAEIVEAEIGDTLMKWGRTSGYNEGTVTDTSAYMKVQYGTFVAAFDDQILTTKMADPGDSGSSVWKKEGATPPPPQKKIIEGLKFRGTILGFIPIELNEVVD